MSVKGLVRVLVGLGSVEVLGLTLASLGPGVYPGPCAGVMTGTTWKPTIGIIAPSEGGTVGFFRGMSRSEARGT